MIDSGDTAWVLACTALVLFMTPGLAFFYAGMVRVRNVLSMMMVNFVPLGVVTVLWLLLGYSIAFGNDAGGGLFGDFEPLRHAEPGQRARAGPARDQPGRGDPAARVRGVPDDVRGHHARAGHRRHRRTGCGSAAGRCSWASGR